MAYRISINTKVSVKPDAGQEATTKVSVTGDTAEEAAQICRVLAALRDFGGRQAQGLVIEEPLAAATNKALPGGTAESAALPPIEIIAPTEDSLPLQEALASYLTTVTVTGLAPASLRYYRYILRRFVRTIGPERCIRAIRGDEISAYLAEYKDRCKPGSIVVYGRIIKGFFNWLVKRGDVRANPMVAIKLRLPPPNPVPPYSDGEIHRLLGAAATPMERVIITLLLDTGMRASELCNLTWADLDLAKGVIKILGKGSKVRHVALNHRPREALTAYVEQAHHYGEGLWPPRFSRQMLSLLLKKLAERANVPRVFPHRFRHTFASTFLRETGDAMALKALLGHSSLMMVQRYIAGAEAETALEAHKQHSPMGRL